MYVQIMTEEQARNHYENPFDITKIWRHKEFPLHKVGVLELNRNPENYFAEVEQSAFTPAHVVPGIGFSPDKFLQGRLFVYGDAQRYRLGVNYNQIPVNRAKSRSPRLPPGRFYADRRQLRRRSGLFAQQHGRLGGSAGCDGTASGILFEGAMYAVRSAG